MNEPLRLFDNAYLVGMITEATWKKSRGWRLRLVSAWRVLVYPRYVLVCWEKDRDGMIDYRVQHKGCDLEEAAMRLKVDVVGMLENAALENEAVYEAERLASGG